MADLTSTSCVIRSLSDLTGVSYVILLAAYQAVGQAGGWLMGPLDISRLDIGHF